MKKFLTRIILFSFFVIAAFFVLDIIISKGLRKTHASTYTNLTKIFNGQINADLIINGSSKAFVQISPKIIDSILNLNSYNLGMDGTEFLPQNLQYSLYEKYNAKPGIIIQIVGNSTLVKKEELYGYIKFAPYLDQKEVSNLTKTYKGYTNADYYLPLIRYMGYPGTIINGVLNFVGFDVDPDTKYYKGYYERDNIWDTSFDKFVKENPNGITMVMDEKSISQFEEYLIKCKKDKVQLFLVYPPTYYEAQAYVNNKKEVVEIYERFSKKYQIPFLNYSNHYLTKSKEYFYNSQHLNKKGAGIFTRQLSVDIKTLMKNEGNN